jgi:hypothetical protein
MGQVRGDAPTSSGVDNMLPGPIIFGPAPGDVMAAARGDAPASSPPSWCCCDGPPPPLPAGDGAGVCGGTCEGTT